MSEGEKPKHISRRWFLLIVYNIICFWIFLYHRSWGLGLTLFEVAHLAPHILHFLRKPAAERSRPSPAIFIKIAAAILLSIMFWFRADEQYHVMVALALVVLNVFLIHELETDHFVPLNYFLKSIIWSLDKLGYYTYETVRFLITRHPKISLTFSHRSSVLIKRVIVGAVVSIPVALALILLFSTADQNFANIFNSFGTLLEHIAKQFEWLSKFQLEWLGPWLLQFGLFWLYLCFVFPSPFPNVHREKDWKDLVVEKLTVAGIVAGIFGLFILTQAKSFSSIVSGFQSGQLNPAIFVRVGFGQLVIACILGLSIFELLKRDVVREQAQHFRRWITYFALTLLTEIFLVSLVAGERVWLYQEVFGFTVARIWGIFSLVFLFIVIAVLFFEFRRKISSIFSAQVYLISVAAILLFAGWLNIDFIVAFNKPPIVENKVDWGYISRLSLDAEVAWTRKLEGMTPMVLDDCQTTIPNYFAEISPYCTAALERYQEEYDLAQHLEYTKLENLCAETDPDAKGWQSYNVTVTQSKKDLCPKIGTWKAFVNRYNDILAIRNQNQPNQDLPVSR